MQSPCHFVPLFRHPALATFNLLPSWLGHMLPSLMLVIRDTRGINREEWETPPEIIIRVKLLYSNDRVPASRLFHECEMKKGKKILICH